MHSHSVLSQSPQIQHATFPTGILQQTTHLATPVRTTAHAAALSIRASKIPTASIDPAVSLEEVVPIAGGTVQLVHIIAKMVIIRFCMEAEAQPSLPFRLLSWNLAGC